MGVVCSTVLMYQITWYGKWPWDVFIYSFIYSFIYLFIYLSIHSFIHCDVWVNGRWYQLFFSLLFVFIAQSKCFFYFSNFSFMRRVIIRVGICVICYFICDMVRILIFWVFLSTPRVAEGIVKKNEYFTFEGFE